MTTVGLDPKKLNYRPREAADALGISRSRVYEFMQAGELASFKFGASRLIPAEALDDFALRMQHGRVDLP